MRVTFRWLLVAVLVALPAAAWGPKTQVAIVSTAAQLLSKSGVAGIDRTLRDLRQGASVSLEQLRELFPEMETNPVNAIEQEMALLSAVRGDRIDPYFSYRLGMLGKVVAEVSAPLQTASPTYKNLYFSDVDKVIGNLTLQPGQREVVEPRAYFSRVLAEAAVNDAVIQREYESGAGFSEVARSTVAKDASRSVDAVADVMYTILTGRAAAGGVSEGQRQRYVLGAFAYYISRGNELEIEAMAKRLDTLVEKTAAMRAQIGDMFREAGMEERAMLEYGQVMEDAPERREVVEKMGDYYVEQGRAALEDERFEEAIDSFQQALEANPLNVDASRLRIEAEEGLAAREARLAAAQGALSRAEELVSLAEEEALRNRYAEAVELLRQAMDSYTEVGEEFPTEAQARMRGEERVKTRIREYRQELTANARLFSGSGYSLDVQRLAGSAGTSLDERSLRALLENEFKAQLDQLEAELEQEMVVR